MATILFRMRNGEPVKEFCNAIDVDRLLKSGYSLSKESLLKKEKADINKTGKLSAKEVKEAAKKAGIDIEGKTVKDLRKELGI